MTPFDLRPGVRVRLLRVQLVPGQPYMQAALQGLIGRTGTVKHVTTHKIAWVEWDQGSAGAFTAECLEREEGSGDA